jgi:hypothetical protein
VLTALGEKATTAAVNLKAPLASPSFTGDVLIMETAVPGQIKHAFRQSGLSEIRTELQVSGDISSNGTVWSQNEACLTGVQAYTKTEVISALALKASLASPALTGTTTAANLTVSGNLTVNGTTTFTQANPHWVAVVINFVGGLPTIIRNGGRYPATSIVRVPGFATGVFQFDFPEHPNGTNYIVSITASAGYGTLYLSSRSSTRFGITLRNTANAFFDTETHVLISAY